MPQIRKDYRWRVLGHSQLGASHVRQNLPNQDKIRSYAPPDSSPPIILAIADGHGSEKSFRSDVGAFLAVETAESVCLDFLEGIGGAAPSAIKTAAEQQIPARIFQNWRRRVKDHFAANPFKEAELDRLEKSVGQTARDRIVNSDQPFVVYGSTLLAALLTNDFMICFQLGDGEILGVDDVTGNVARVIPKDELLIANETTSLCEDDALKYFRCRFQLFQELPPGLVLLTTDGYPNSFESPEDFEKAGRDYLDLLRKEGGDSVQKSLPGWLEKASRDGSGDDTTVGIIYRCEPPLSEPAVPVNSATESPVVESGDLGARVQAPDGNSEMSSPPPNAKSNPVEDPAEKCSELGEVSSRSSTRPSVEVPTLSLAPKTESQLGPQDTQPPQAVAEDNPSSTLDPQPPSSQAPVLLGTPAAVEVPVELVRKEKQSGASEFAESNESSRPTAGEAMVADDLERQELAKPFRGIFGSVFGRFRRKRES